MPKKEELKCDRHGTTTHKLMSDGIGRKRRFKCLSCLRERQQRVRVNKKLKLISDFGGKCILCGYNKHYASLEFHHLDPSTKTMKLSKAISERKMDECIKEANKCVLLCSNCHGEVEANYGPAVSKLMGWLTRVELASPEPQSGVLTVGPQPPL